MELVDMVEMMMMMMMMTASNNFMQKRPPQEGDRYSGVQEIYYIIRNFNAH
jgi:hypothetical protein